MLLLELAQLARRGLVAGPDEEEKMFTARIASLSIMPCAYGALNRLEKIYGMRPDWLKVSFSRAGLRPWEGGFFLFDHSPKLVLHPKLARNKRLFGLYSRDEILAHELVHAVRARFNEPRFEEHLAYATSLSALRRSLGPLFGAPHESLLFVALSFAVAFLAPWTFFGALIVAGALISFTGYLAIRLFCRSKELRRAEKRLALLLKDSQRARGALLFLTDAEIQLASRDILALVHHLNGQKQVRVAQLLALYPELARVGGTQV